MVRNANEIIWIEAVLSRARVDRLLNEYPYDEEINLRSGTRLAAAPFGVAAGGLTL